MMFELLLIAAAAAHCVAITSPLHYEIVFELLDILDDG